MTSTALSPVDAQVVEECQLVLALHARSFRWGQLFLPRDVAADAAVVYAFCRAADDAVDEAITIEAGAQALDAIRAQFEGTRPAGPMIARFKDIVAERGIPQRAVLDLLDGIGSDSGPVAVADDGELLRYCYRVAGTVGVLMCGVLRVTDPGALKNAIDLGVGMQLTNICRDVREDFARGRTYLPKERLDAFGPAPLEGEGAEEAVSAVVNDLLDLADRYYQSGFEGLRFIPFRARFAIVVAATLYRAIGHQLRASGGNAWAGRTIVSPLRKVVLLARSVARFFFLPRSRRHPPELHAPFRALLRPLRSEAQSP